MPSWFLIRCTVERGDKYLLGSMSLTRWESWRYCTSSALCVPECVWFSSPRFLVQFRQDKVCVKFIQGNQKNGSVPTCKRKNNRLLEVAVP